MGYGAVSSGGPLHGRLRFPMLQTAACRRRQARTPLRSPNCLLRICRLRGSSSISPTPDRSPLDPLAPAGAPL